MEDGTRVENQMENRDELCRRCYQMKGEHTPIVAYASGWEKLVYICPNAIGQFAGDMRKPGQVS